MNPQQMYDAKLLLIYKEEFMNGLLDKWLIIVTNME
jgi:hypothetical protein